MNYATAVGGVPSEGTGTGLRAAAPSDGISPAVEGGAVVCDSGLLITTDRLKEIMGTTDLGAFALDEENESRWVLTGEVDITVHEAFRAVWPAGRRSSTAVEVDMSAVTFIDSSGLRILYDARAASPEGELPTLTDVPERVRWVIDVTGLTDLFVFTETASES